MHAQDPREQRVLLTAQALPASFVIMNEQGSVERSIEMVGMKLDCLAKGKGFDQAAPGVPPDEDLRFLMAPEAALLLAQQLKQAGLQAMRSQT